MSWESIYESSNSEIVIGILIGILKIPVASICQIGIFKLRRYRDYKNELESVLVSASDLMLEFGIPIKKVISIDIKYLVELDRIRSTHPYPDKEFPKPLFCQICYPFK